MTTDYYIKSNEGIRLEAYKDTRGNWTIGWGHKLEGWEPAITIAQAEALYNADMLHVYQDILRELPWAGGICDDRVVVIVDMCFQMGIHGLLKFVNFLDAFRRQQWSTAAQQLQFSELARQCPARVERHIRVLERGVII